MHVKCLQGRVCRRSQKWTMALITALVTDHVVSGCISRAIRPEWPCKSTSEPWGGFSKTGLSSHSCCLHMSAPDRLLCVDKARKYSSQSVWLLNKLLLLDEWSRVCKHHFMPGLWFLSQNSAAWVAMRSLRSRAYESQIRGSKREAALGLKGKWLAIVLEHVYCYLGIRGSLCMSPSLEEVVLWRDNKQLMPNTIVYKPIYTWAYCYFLKTTWRTKDY